MVVAAAPAALCVCDRSIGMQMHAAITRNGGTTRHWLTDEEPMHGYAVSCHKDRETRIPLDDFTPCDVDRFIAANCDLLSTTDEYIGGWIEGCLVYLDVSCVVADLKTALTLGCEHQQIAVWDFQTRASIYV